MGYHYLSESTLNDAERREEANRIVKMIENHVENAEDRERGFLMKMADESSTVSVKQLFWLRDLKEKYLP